MIERQRKAELLIKYPKAFSVQSFPYEDLYRVSCGIFYGRYHIVIRPMWSKKPILDQVVWYWEHGYEQLVREWRLVVAKFCQRLAAEEKAALTGGRATDSALEQDYPALYEYMTLDWLEGKARQTATIGLSVDAGKWKARLADRENGLVLFVSADGFYEALGTLEKALASGTADWRTDQFASPGKGKRK